MAFLLSLAACGGGGGGGPEIWVVDFQTHAADYRADVEAAGVDLDDLAARALLWLERYYDGFPVEFVLGDTTTPGANYICVRRGDGLGLGRGFLDPGNVRREHSCGMFDGRPLGVFADAILRNVQALAGDTVVDAETYARLLAVVLAHEIGHGLGLTHSGGVGDIMSTAGLQLGFAYDFRTEDRRVLAQNFGMEPETIGAE